jgi:hypothetical protein
MISSKANIFTSFQKLRLLFLRKPLTRWQAKERFMITIAYKKHTVSSQG